MHIQEILTAAIVFVPACYAALVAVQFASGLAKLGKRINAPAVTPIVPAEPQKPSPDHIANAVQMEDPWLAPVEVTPATASGDAPAATSGQPIALLPAFIPAVQVEATAEDHALIEAAWIAHYCNAGLTDVVVSFKRRPSATQKPQQQHPAIEGMTLRAMRQLGAELRIKGARRWNTAQAIEALNYHYRSAA